MDAANDANTTTSITRAQRGADPIVPQPPLLVRSAGFWFVPHGLVKLRGTVAMGFDMRAETLCFSGKIRVFPLAGWRVVALLLVVAGASWIGGLIGGPWLHQLLTASVAATGTAAGESPSLAGLCTAIGAFAVLLPAAFLAWLVLTVDLQRFDIPALALSETRLSDDRLSIGIAPHGDWQLWVLSEQKRTAEQLTAILNRVAAVVREAQSPTPADGLAPTDFTTPPPPTPPPADPSPSALPSLGISGKANEESDNAAESLDTRMS